MILLSDARAANRPVIGNLAEAKSILVVKLDHIGDFVLASSFLRGLRSSAPTAQIDLVVTPEAFPLAELCPYVNRVISWSVQADCLTVSARDQAIAEGFLEDYRRGAYEIAVTPRWDYDYWAASAVARASNAPLVVGYPTPQYQSNLPLNRDNYTHVLERHFSAHETEHNLALLEFLGGRPQGEHLEVWLGREDLWFATNRLAQLPGAGPLAVVCPGAALPRKTLSAEKLAAILRRVAEQLPELRFLVVGSEADKPFSRELTGRVPRCYSLCGETTIRQAAALIQCADLMIGMDSGPGHIAAASNVPVVVFSCFAADGNPIRDCSPARWRPVSQAEVLVIQPKHNYWPCESVCGAAAPHCIQNIVEEEAAQAITGLFRRRTSSISRRSRFYRLGKCVIELPVDHQLDAIQSQHRLYDRFLPFLTKQIGEGQWIVDVGANIGDTTAAIAQTTPASILCVEGHPGYFELLQKNVARMPDEIRARVTPVQELVGRNGNGQSLVAANGTASFQRDDGAMPVNMILLDSLLARQQIDPQSVALLKTDTDGFDAEVLLSAGRLIAEHSPILYFENQCETDDQFRSFETLYQTLMQHGYEYCWVFDNFGNLLLEEVSLALMKPLNRYIAVENRGWSARTIYYYDILACKEENVGTVRGAIEQFQENLAHPERVFDERRPVEI